MHDQPIASSGAEANADRDRRRVIILAAGRGARLRPISDQCPKALIEVGGKALLRHTLEKLEATGRVEGVTIVVGFRAEQIRDAVEAWSPGMPVTFLDNDSWSSTNSIHSLWLSRSWWRHGFVLIDSDIWFDDRLLEPLFSVDTDALIVDRGRRYADIDMKVTIRDGHVWHLDKRLAPGETDGEFFGMSYFSPAGAARLESVVAEYASRGDTGTWYEWAIRDLAKEAPILAWPMADLPWCEIDDARDLEQARDLLEEVVG